MEISTTDELDTITITFCDNELDILANAAAMYNMGTSEMLIEFAFSALHKNLNNFTLRHEIFESISGVK